MNKLSQQRYSRTPSVVIHDNRGASIREINYCRHPDSLDKTDERITRHHYHARGYLQHSIDARLYDTQQSDTSIQPNIQQTVSLGGAIALSQGVDNGTSFSLNDIEGLAAQQINAQGTVTTYEYADQRFVRHLENVKEGTLGENNTRMIQRLEWASYSDQSIAKNQVGKCIRHYDSAGLKTYNSYSLQGDVLSETQQLLTNGEFINWTVGDGHDETIQTAEKHITQRVCDATGAVLTETDSAGHQRRLAYDIAGFVKQSWLTLKGQAEQVILRSLTYSAAGQKLREEQGNGLVTTYEYEPETQRLLHIKTERPQGHALGAKVMQDLRYEYDAVGNIICLKNDAEATRYWRNQKVVPENRYIYDSLYQLISATGRESANQQTPASMQSQPVTTLAKDTQSYTNYTRFYTYDRGGNLTQIRHTSSIAQQSFTQDIIVSNKTNRALLKSQCSDLQKVDSYFDVSGNLTTLSTGAELTWNARNTLEKTTHHINSSSFNNENYCYNSSNQRTVKIREHNIPYDWQSDNGDHESIETMYLPNIEKWQYKKPDQSIKQKYDVVHIHTGTSANVRALCWEIGLPKEIENNQLRYRYDDGIGNSGLETDGQGKLVSYEEYYPYGGTAIWFSQNALEATYKTIRYSGKEKDATGLYYYGYRYYQPWVGRWLSADPAGTVDGLNLYRMVRNNPVTLHDPDGRMPKWFSRIFNRGSERDKGSVEYLMHGLPTKSKVATTIKDSSAIESFIYEKSSPDKRDIERDKNYTVSKFKIFKKMKFKLYSTQEGLSKNLIIFAHGAFNAETNDTDIPKGVTLNFLSPHDTILSIEEPAIVTVAAKRDYTFASVSNKYMKAKTANAKDIFTTQGALGITGSSEPNKVKNYQLVPDMDYDDTVYGNAISLNRYAEKIGYKEPTLRSDILTLDKSSGQTSLEHILYGLKTKGLSYKTITCSFCRSSDNPPKYDIYHSTFLRK